MSKMTDSLGIIICECGHQSTEHRGGNSDCTAPGCKCTQLHEVVDGSAMDKHCTECGRDYRCSMSRVNSGPLGVCNVCMKEIEKNYAGDSMPYLFGWREDRKSQLYAKALATDVLKSGVTIRQLWDYWKVNHG